MEEEFKKKTDDIYTNQLYRLDQALIMKYSDWLQDKMKAQMLFKQLAKEEVKDAAGDSIEDL